MAWRRLTGWCGDLGGKRVGVFSVMGELGGKRVGSSGAGGTSAEPRPLRGPKTRPVQYASIRMRVGEARGGGMAAADGMVW